MEGGGKTTPPGPAAVGSCFRRNDEVGAGMTVCGKGGEEGRGEKMGSRVRGNKRG